MFTHTAKQMAHAQGSSFYNRMDKNFPMGLPSNTPPFISAEYGTGLELFPLAINSIDNIKRARKLQKGGAVQRTHRHSKDWDKMPTKKMEEFARTAKMKEEGGAFPLAAIIAGATAAHAALQKIQPASRVQNYLETADWLNGKRDSVPYKIIKGGTQALKSFLGYGFVDHHLSAEEYDNYFSRWVAMPEQRKWIEDMRKAHKIKKQTKKQMMMENAKVFSSAAMIPAEIHSGRAKSHKKRKPYAKTLTRHGEKGVMFEKL